MNHKLVNVKLTKRQNQARLMLQERNPGWNLSERVREMLAADCREHGIAWPDDMPPVGNPDLVQYAEDLESLMDIQGAMDRDRNE